MAGELGVEGHDPNLLSGVRVLDCSRLLPCAYGTQMLAELGADVLKIEPPGGEYGRAMAAHFAMSNRGKQSITVDLGSAAGRAEFEALVAERDIVVESFRPGVLGELGLGFDRLIQVNPAIVLISVTGYGQDGPLSQRPGHDLNYMALSGNTKVHSDWPPLIPPLPVADMSVGLGCAFMVAAAAADQRRGGGGRHIDLSMADLCLSMNVFGVAGAHRGESTEASDSRLQDLPWPDISVGETPCYGVYPTADGRFLALGNVEPKFWTEFLVAIDRTDLADDRFATGERAATVKAEIAAVIAGRSSAEWEELLGGGRICVSLVNTPEQAVVDPHYRARGMTWRDAAGYTQLGFPAVIDGTRPGAPS